MFTVNLEKELIRQNKRIATPEELLTINEYEKHAGMIDNDALQRVGLNQNLKIGKEKKNSLAKLLADTQRFQKERVFHVSQIKAICEKYYLRFLPSDLYKGTIDEQLPFKIVNFEAAYGVNCKAGDSYVSGNTYIAAPASSFKLERRPKDPLFFYKINDEYFYLIHKWGNDISITRRLMAFFSSALNTQMVLQTIFLAIGVSLGLQMGASGVNWIGVIGLSVAGACFAHVIGNILTSSEVDPSSPLDPLFRKNEWDSPFL